MKKKKTIFKVMTVVLAVIILLLAVYIILAQKGLNPDYDFGAGAYYYTDAPDLQEIADKASYSTAVPKWIYYALFLFWGALMYSLWKWIDRH